MFLMVFLLGVVYAGVTEQNIERGTDIVDIILLSESKGFIEGYSNGTCKVYNSSLVYQTDVTCCTSQLITLASLAYNDCWFIGCTSSMKIYCMIQSLEDQRQLETSVSIQYIPVWPYLDIHVFQKNIVYHCDISSFRFQCQSFTFSSLDAIKSMWVNEKEQSVKVLTAKGKSRVFVYMNGSQPFSIEISQTVYSVAQDIYEIYIWTETGIYKCNRQDNETQFSYVDNFGFKPRTKWSLVYLDSSLYYLKKDYTLSIKNLTDTSTTTTMPRSPTTRLLARTDLFKKLKNAREGLFAFLINSSNLKWLISTSTKTAFFTPSPISKLFKVSAQYQQLFSNLNTFNNTNDTILNTTNMTNASANETDTDNLANNNSISNQTSDSTSLVELKTTYLCDEGCKKCLWDKTCCQCEEGYFLANSSCKQKTSFSIATSMLAFPYSSVILKIILLQFMEEFWYHQYHNHEYSKQVNKILQTIGNMNRKKFIPIFIKQIVGQDLYNKYQRQKHNWGFTNSTPFTDEKYLQKEKQPINFTVHTSKMYIWNYLLSMSFFMIQRILAFLLSGFEILKRPFRKSTVSIVIVMILVEGHIQFIVFTFFRQIRNPAAHVFLDKVNLVVAVVFMFVVLFYTVTSYVLFSWFLTKKEVKILYPFTAKSKAKTMALVMFLGPGRNFLLGVFQSFYENFELQMMLLIGLNFVTLLIFRILKNTNIPNYLMIFKNGSIIIITIFLTAGLFSSMNFVLASETYSAIQLICICSLWSICVLDFFYGFTSFMIELVHEIRKKKPNKVANSHENKVKDPKKKIKKTQVNLLKKQQPKRETIFVEKL